jgi:2-phospho-L-lactate guanylyltransferase
VLAIVPVNAPQAAKRRLEPVLSAEERAELVVLMLQDVVAACRAARRIRGVLVVTPEPSVVPPDVDALPDPGTGHAAAIDLALGHAPSDGALVVMADCPLVLPETLDRLAESARPVALAPARDGGTNALALRPPNAIEPRFGVTDGAKVLIERARRDGIEPVVIEDARLAADVDTPEDLRRVLELGEGTRSKAFLERIFSIFAEVGLLGELPSEPVE